MREAKTAASEAAERRSAAVMAAAVAGVGFKGRTGADQARVAPKTGLSGMRPAGCAGRRKTVVPRSVFRDAGGEPGPHRRVVDDEQDRRQARGRHRIAEGAVDAEVAV